MAVLLTGRNPIKTYETIIVTATETVTAHPVSYDSSEYSYDSISNESNPIGKGSDNTTYATINLKTGGSAETYVYYNFDLSSIPSNATIDSVTCVAKGYISNASSTYIPTRTIQLYSGSIAKGGSATLTTTATTHTFDGGAWTREELNDCRIKLYAKRGSFMGTSTARNMQFYGADLTITYTYDYEEEKVEYI